ncbi:LysR substrate-binding domain-containing protein [Sphingomonas sp. AOB5]|uniref:LysR substrate-binding domain-containing protein n=1 Tax=Sphingomonas sp. AOB5 TaxID=3034017 RepID=UPI0023F6C30C|nr:LysR substrate-binding domain-containing protein [Sphingomonas sp. AOB5]MDF7775608.1 LysR substrate-binding domain-containing protein [Sphingomonas sp. AOB5]
MKLNQIRDVLAVHERGSIRAAARHIGIAQPAVSRSIRELEHDLGVALFERSARGITLTPMGHLFMKRASAVHNELQQARDEIDQHRGQTTGLVRVGLSTVAHLSLLPGALDRFRARYPRVTLKIQEGLFPALEAALKEGALDFYAGPLAETPAPQEFVVETLFENMRRVFCRKGHKLAGATSLAALRDAEWISTTVTSNQGAELLPLFEGLGLAPPIIALHAPSALSMVLAAAHSDLLVMLPEQWLDSPLTRELLDCIPVVEALPGAPICMLHRARLPLTPAAEYLSDMLRRSALNRPNLHRGAGA